MELLIWAGKVSLYWLLFYGCFYFFLRKLTHFRWNRGYLLGSLLLSLLLPFVQLPQTTTEPLSAFAVQLDPMSILPPAESGPAVSWLMLLGIAYFSIVAFRLGQLAMKIYKLSQIRKSALSIDSEDGAARIYLLPDDKMSSFSFFNNIAISPADYAGHFEDILSHEMVHVRQRHSFDILLTELLLALFWFHPVLSFYKKSLQEIHEYLADEKTHNRDAYAEFLVAYTMGVPKLSLVNTFYNSSLLKHRIQMLYSNKSSKWKLSLYGISGLLGLALIVVVAACSDTNQLQESDTPVLMPPVVDSRGNIGEEKIFTAVEKNPEYPGGVAEMYKFIGTHVKYPAAASRANVSGRVFLQFVVRTDGSISDVMVVKGIGFGCDEEAIRVVKAMPKWSVGTQGGVPVNVRYTLPINFQLEGGDEPADPAVSILTDVKPIYVINGKIREMRQEDMPKPEDIESIHVWKGDQAIEKYGEKGKDGVIEILLKEGN